MDRTARQRLAVAVLMVLVGMALLVRDRDAARHQERTPDVTVVEGWAMPNAAGTAISLHPLDDPSGAGGGYIVAGAPWRFDGAWHEGGTLPTCVGDEPGARTRVRLGVARTTSPEVGTRDTVVWMECLSQPVG